ncbi:MAG: cytochrome o ubiquinol oxidase subunit IV [Ferrovum sp. 37-45-19]|jgi:cytochrome o ubiquinol oxidase operon protein cyoD|uniref:cytochrome o ubiquinol oxidase subunit IV n=1 Tax=Ferrovum sp. JA12 TaxID=1356299 RepID=UPI000703127B|nr:cytochrome o ubiquinol oxidase subunit IV [Ferrovum sp. JA12]OYV79294.1 MAG: cytochrome o ubiquinol oxidase subunit IV [Ferrovum sp. 21-44-67]OYV94152.1 MAG: cytochrome o ubiquinol oxidase subunit IV [Ferrovum sp. 37-45-19]OZB34328.1 MAG: cytochrome o ubiquinol oxidase subunit IV [Ferrovum sp. 34-44-207]HQT81419.1 cytochrome o ubiquinol oxidase subunit IV [Ferrovaceae bacterium]KRH78491.1 cytochrome bo(3) ubiquinol oxidase subunit 4 [Ferrovum sp. JA12]
MSHSDLQHDVHPLSAKSYVVGFSLSLLLTVLAFGAVMSGLLKGIPEIIAVIICAVIQIYVQLRYFLHLDGSSEQRWNVMSFAYTVVVIALLVVGSLWIMYNMHKLMMPGA